MIPFLRHKNNQLLIDQSPLLNEALEETVLTEQASASDGTLTVENIQGFAVDQILLIGELGEEGAEIIETNDVNSPSGTTITLASNIDRAHSVGTRVRVVKFDQIHLQHTASNVDIFHSDLTTSLGSGLIACEPDQQVVVYDETEHTSGFYAARFKNSISGEFGDYTGYVPYGGYDRDSAGYVVAFALRRNGLDGFSAEVTKKFCLDEITDCLRYLQDKQLRWPQQERLDIAIGQTERGSFIFDLPPDIYDDNTNKAILAVRIGTGSRLRYIDPLEWEDSVIKGQARTSTMGSHSAGETSLKISDSYDFTESGSATFFADGEKYSITYTGVIRDSEGEGFLTGVPASGEGSISVTIPDSTHVFQGEVEEGEPDKFTVRGRRELEIHPICGANHADKNVYLDYLAGANEISEMTDELDYERYELVKNWLVFKVRMQIENNGKLDFRDGDWLLFKERLNDHIRNKAHHIKYKLQPKINRIMHR